MKKHCTFCKYNPFKMWGSYIGVSIALIEIIFAPIQRITNTSFVIKPIYNFFNCMDSSRNLCIGTVNSPATSQIIHYGLLISAGFLIGWGIHSLIRRFIK